MNRSSISLLNEGDSMKKVLITGVAGQDDAYLVEFLLNKGYEAYRIKRRTSLLFNNARVDSL